MPFVVCVRAAPRHRRQKELDGLKYEGRPEKKKKKKKRVGRRKQKKEKSPTSAAAVTSFIDTSGTPLPPPQFSIQLVGVESRRCTRRCCPFFFPLYFQCLSVPWPLSFLYVCAINSPVVKKTSQKKIKEMAKGGGHRRDSGVLKLLSSSIPKWMSTSPALSNHYTATGERGKGMNRNAL